MNRRSLLLGFMLAPIAARVRAAEPPKPVAVGRVINLPRNQAQLARLIREATQASGRHKRWKDAFRNP